VAHADTVVLAITRNPPRFMPWALRAPNHLFGYSRQVVIFCPHGQHIGQKCGGQPKMLRIRWGRLWISRGTRMTPPLLLLPVLGSLIDVASPLAVRAPERGALPQHRLPDRRAAGLARLARAAVDHQLAEEVAGCTVRGEEVAQRGAAAFDRMREDAFHFGGEPCVAGARHAAGFAARGDAGGEQRLAGVDVA